MLFLFDKKRFSHKEKMFIQTQRHVCNPLNVRRPFMTSQSKDMEITNSIQSQRPLNKYTKQEQSKHGPPKHQRWDQVPWRSEHPLPTGHTRRVLVVIIRK